jgi:hypothetical protein
MIDVEGERKKIVSEIKAIESKMNSINAWDDGFPELGSRGDKLTEIKDALEYLAEIYPPQKGDPFRELLWRVNCVSQARGKMETAERRAAEDEAADQKGTTQSRNLSDAPDHDDDIFDDIFNYVADYDDEAKLMIADRQLQALASWIDVQSDSLYPDDPERSFGGPLCKEDEILENATTRFTLSLDAGYPLQWSTNGILIASSDGYRELKAVCDRHGLELRLIGNGLLRCIDPLEKPNYPARLMGGTYFAVEIERAWFMGD